MKSKPKAKKIRLGPVVSLRISEQQFQIITELAKAKDRSVGYVLRELIAAGLQA